MYDSHVQKMGLGTTVRYFEQSYTLDPSGVNYITASDLKNSDEFMSFANIYNFIKLEKVMILILPSSNNGEISILADWNYGDTNQYTINDIKVNDSTKVIPTHMVQYRKRTWLPPDIIVRPNGTSNNIAVARYNPIGTIASSDSYGVRYPIRFYIASNSANTIKVIYKARFRGARFKAVTNKVMNDPEVIELIKKKEEIYMKQNKVKQLKPLIIKEEEDEDDGDEDFFTRRSRRTQNRRCS
jgi:hypothetical protein